MLTAGQRNYVQKILREWGWRPQSLGDADLVGIFHLLARREEHESGVRHNNHNWELSLGQISRREQALRPVVEEQIATWREQGKIAPLSSAAEVQWPSNKRFALCLTHDIDILQEYLWRERLRHLWRVRTAPGEFRAKIIGSFLKQVARRFLAVPGLKSPPLDSWLEVEDRFGFRSTCHFFADTIATRTWDDVFYRYDDTVIYDGKKCPIGEVVGRIADAGWDVGLHGSHRAHFDEGILQAELESVEAAARCNVVSARQHHLTYDIRTTPIIQERVGLRIDSSLGSNIDIGFRCGTGMPFRMYDLVGDRPLDLIQIPLVVQDNPLAALSANDEKLMVARCVELMERVARVGGAITLLWHNQHRPGSLMFRVYERVLEEAAQRGAWGCSMSQLNSWCRDQWSGSVDCEIIEAA